MASAQPPRWYVISLRPRGDHAALRKAAARHGAGLVAMSPWQVVGRDDDATRQALASALAADIVLFTSPAAVRHAARLQPLARQARQCHVAVGTGTAQALRRVGGGPVVVPARMDSEGLLDLPELQCLQGRTLGLVTAPDGRQHLLPALLARGAQVRRADVYQRVDLPFSAAALSRLRACDAPLCLLASSDGALQRATQQWPADVRQRLQATKVVVASPRLADRARQLGFTRVDVAAGPRPAQMLAAASVSMDTRPPSAGR